MPAKFFAFLAITLLTLLSLFTGEGRALSAAESGSWVAPTSWVDSEGLWVEVPLSFDESSASYAADQSNRVGDGPWLELRLPQAVRTDRALVVADFGFGIVDAVHLEAQVAGSWVPVFSGAIENVADAIVPFSSVVTTDALRFRFHYVTDGYYFWLYNFAVFSLPTEMFAPQVTTTAATSVTATTAALHGVLSSDGGEPCAMRFQYRKASFPEYTSTPWSTSASVSGQTGSTALVPVVGLRSGVEYRYRIQAKNAMGISSGAEVTFTPQPVPLGMVEWLSASNVSAEPLLEVGADPALRMTWDTPVNALDDDLSTAARCYHPLWAPQWGPYLNFTLPEVLIDHVRLSAGVNPYIDALQIDIQQNDGTWQPVFNGAFADRAWQIYPLATPDIYPHARVRFHVTTTAVGTNWALYDFQVRMPVLVSWAANVDQSLTQPGHVDLALRMQPSPSSVPLTLTISGGGVLQAGTDWSFTSGTAASASNASTRTVEIPAGSTAPSVGLDLLPESRSGSMSMTIANATSAQIAAPAHATVTLRRPMLMLPTPTIQPAAGSFTAAITVTATDVDSAATLRYTSDGSTPTATSALLPSNGIPLDHDATISVIAFRDEWRRRATKLQLAGVRALAEALAAIQRRTSARSPPWPPRCTPPVWC